MRRPLSPLRVLLAGSLAALAGCAAKTPTYTGYIEADYALIAAPQSGWITHVNVDRGATIKSGDALFTLDADLQAAAESEASQRAAAEHMRGRCFVRAEPGPLDAEDHFEQRQ